eukprot:SAG31_NODE_2211_length_6179_cov_2.919572_10_plen_131_part_00
MERTEDGAWVRGSTAQLGPFALEVRAKAKSNSMDGAAVSTSYVTLKNVLMADVTKKVQQHHLRREGACLFQAGAVSLVIQCLSLLLLSLEGRHHPQEGFGSQQGQAQAANGQCPEAACGSVTAEHLHQQL